MIISSGVSRAGRAGATAYATAKTALGGLVAAVKWEAGQAGVLVNVVTPGFTLTGHNYARFGDEVRESVASQTPSRKLSRPQDVAAAVIFWGRQPTPTSPAVTSRRRGDRLTWQR